jgi:hypothetical protein
MTEVDWNGKRDGLTSTRDRLFKQFEAAPTNARVGQEIKKLDDEIAECTEQLRLNILKGRTVTLGPGRPGET